MSLAEQDPPPVWVVRAIRAAVFYSLVKFLPLPFATLIVLGAFDILNGRVKNDVHLLPCVADCG
jgi:hypothetical protein